MGSVALGEDDSDKSMHCVDLVTAGTGEEVNGWVLSGTATPAAGVGNGRVSRFRAEPFVFAEKL